MNSDLLEGKFSKAYIFSSIIYVFFIHKDISIPIFIAVPRHENNQCPFIDNWIKVI